MGRITLDDSHDGLGAFPAEYRVVGRDDAGDVIAVDAKGKVWCFAHGTGDWATAGSLAFANEALLQEHVAFQDHFDPPPHDADLAALRARRAAIQQFMKGRKGTPYSRSAASSALETLREAIEDERFAGSKQGKGLAATQAIGLQCDQALRDAGAPGAWLCRALASDAKALGVQGTFAPPWTTERVAALLRPLVGSLRLQFFERGQPKA
jgi:hypothetical protein